MLKVRNSIVKFFGFARTLLSSRRFRRLLLGYAAVFMLPLVLLGGWIFRSAVTERRSDIESETLGKLGIIAEMVDQQLEYAEYVAYDVGGTSCLRPYVLPASVSSTMEGIEALSQYRLSNDFWEDIYYCLESNAEKVYSTKGIMDREVLTRVKLGVSDEQGQAMYAQLNQLDGTMKLMSLRNQNTNDDQLLCLLPVQHPAARYDGAVICQVNLKNLRNILAAFGNHKCAIYIMDSNGGVLLAQRPRLWPDDGILAGLPSSESVSETEYGSDAYSVVSCQSEQYGLRYAVVMPADLFYQKTQSMRNTVTGLITLAGVMGAMMIALLSWHSYRLMKIMRDIAVEEMPQLNGSHTDELNAILEMVSHSREQRTQLEHSMQNQKQQIMNQTLRLLLSGFKAEDEPVLRRAMEAANICLDRGMMTVFLLADQDGVRRQSAVDAAQLRESFRHTPYQVYPYPRADLGALAIVASHPEGEQADLAKLLHDEMQTVGECDPILAVGGQCRKISQLASMLNQACAALKWARSHFAGGVVFFDGLEDESDGIDELKRQHVQAIHQGDADLALRLVEQLIAQLTANHSYEFARAAACELINGLLTLNKELKAELDARDISAAMRYDTLDRLCATLNSVTRQMAETVSMRRARSGANRSHELLDYVERSFQDPDLSLKRLADEFDLSPNYVSHILRESAGTGFSEYLSDLRMRYVKERLVATDVSIKEIVLSAGYRDVPNFMRKFKQVMGVTPGEYRKNNPR